MITIEQATPEREQQILDAIAAGDFEHTWTPITSDARGSHAKIWVSADALKVRGPRVTTNAATCQRIADMLGASLCTTRVMDLAWEQADIRIPPQLQTADAHMSDWSRTVQHSLAIDRLITAGSLVRNVGKAWVLSDRIVPGVAANYGWYDKKAPYTSWSGMRMWQTLGTRHNDKHVDYSQTVQLMRNTLEVDGAPLEMDTVMQHPELSWLVNDDGKMRVRRMPGIDILTKPTEPPPVTTLVLPNLPEIKFVQARNFHRGRTGGIDLIVLHTMEAAEKPTTAENVAAWFAGANAPIASAHYCIDSDSIVQCVLESDTAWHAPGGNSNGIGIEHAGYAAQSATDWSDEYSRRMLGLSAALCADICKRHNIPPVALASTDLLAGKRGITTHAAVSLAWKKSSHTDPGKNFPMLDYIAAVRGAIP